MTEMVALMFCFMVEFIRLLQKQAQPCLYAIRVFFFSFFFLN